MPRSGKAAIRRRIALAMLVVAAIFAVFVGRLVDIQVVRADSLNDEAASRRTGQVVEVGARGSIVSADGAVLAEDVERYDIVADPTIIADPKSLGSFDRTVDGVSEDVSFDTALIELGKATGVKATTIEELVTENPKSQYALVAKGVSAARLAKVQALKIPWIAYQTRSERTYPAGALAGNLVGFMGTDGPGAGVELYMDACLEGQDGKVSYEVSGDGRNVPIPGTTVQEQEAVDGGTVELTIDADLQAYAQQVIGQEAKRLDAKFASAFVVEAKTGRILAVAESPTVDPNDPGATESQTYTSWSFTSPFEPGSVFKPMTMASLMDLGLVDPTTHVEVPYIWRPDGLYVKDALPHDTQHLTATGVLSTSSNVGMSKLSTRMTRQQIYDYQRAFGVGQVTGVEFQGESEGLLGTADSWDAQTRLNITYGAGVSVTMAQLAGIYQTLANDGEKIPLSLVDGCRLADGTVVDTPDRTGTQVVSEQTATRTQKMLENVLNKGGLKETASVPGYRVGIKTGTAEVAINGRYTGERFLTVAGMAPIEDPQYVVITTFGYSNAEWSSAAAPAFRKIMAQVLKTNGVAPSTTKASDLPITY